MATANLMSIDHPQFRQTRKVVAAVMFVDRGVRMARVILASIRQEYPQADYFTREDLLQLPVLQHVATITRYHDVCTAVRRLVVERQLFEVTRTELCINGKQDQINMEPLSTTYGHTVEFLVRRQVEANPKEPFGVMDIVYEWTTDPHLTLNTKRVAVRQVLRHLARGDDAIISANDDFTFVFTGVR